MDNETAGRGSVGGNFEADYAQAAWTASRIGFAGPVPVNPLINLAAIEENLQVGTVQVRFFFHAWITSAILENFTAGKISPKRLLARIAPFCWVLAVISAGANWIKPPALPQ